VSAMFRHKVLRELGGFDSTYRYAEDRDLFIRLREHGVGIAVLDDVVLHKRLHGANMTMNRPERHPILRSLKEKLDRQRAAGSGV
jgi:GT2 family glycosyltransferase